MKMPPQKSGNGYYGYENQNNSTVEPLPTDDNEEIAPNAAPQQNSNTGNADDEFSEYLWMENEEEFDKQVLQQLEEEELMEQCMEAMLDEHCVVPPNLLDERTNRTNSQCSQASDGSEILNLVNNFRLDLVDVAKSTLNPLAAEFVPDVHPTSRMAGPRND